MACVSVCVCVQAHGRKWKKCRAKRHGKGANGCRRKRWIKCAVNVGEESSNETSEIKARWIAVVTALLKMVIVARGKTFFALFGISLLLPSSTRTHRFRLPPPSPLSFPSSRLFSFSAHFVHLFHLFISFVGYFLPSSTRAMWKRFPALLLWFIYVLCSSSARRYQAVKL